MNKASRTESTAYRQHDRVQPIDNKPNYALRRTIAVGLALGALAGTYKFAIEPALDKAMGTDVCPESNLHAYIVQPGDTSWEIALGIDADKPRTVLNTMQDLNDTNLGKIVSGEVLVVPNHC